MAMPPPHLVVDLDAAAVEQALTDWRWLIGPDARPLYATVGGDVLLVDPDGRVLLLDTGGGTVTAITDSVAAFEGAISDPANLDDWFSASLAGRLRQQGVVLGPGQCYGYTILPVFQEGSYGPENRRALDALEHLSVTADMHEQVRGLPNGAKVQMKVVD